VLWPCLLLRFLGYYKYRNDSYYKMRDYIFFVDSYQYISFGTWTIYNFLLISSNLGICQDMKPTTTLTELNYELLLVIGIFPAVMIIGFALMALVCFPCIAWSFYQERRQHEAQQERTREMIRGMFRAPWNRRVFNSTDCCAICLVDFKEDA
jgi:hypothetical protein